jgi:pimeloyl-ACP methyl ester carboxylesterase
MVAEVLKMCCVDPSRVPADVVEQHVELARARGDFAESPAAMIEAARSLMLFLARRRRFAVMADRVTCPVLLLHGDSDRLVPLASAQAVLRAQPAWRFEVARGLGHVPQLEDPAWTADRILDWLSTEAVGDAVDAACTHAHGPALAAEACAEEQWRAS